MFRGVPDENICTPFAQLNDRGILLNVRAKNGATMNSLAFSESRLESNIQNLELAGGRIMDADMAGEMTDLAKHQILLQTATDSLTKHNKLSVKVDKTLMGLDTSF